MANDRIEEEYSALERLGYTNRRMVERQKDYWANLQNTDGFYLITQAQKDFLDNAMADTLDKIHWELTTEAATTIAAANTLYLMAGTTTSDHAINFTQVANNSVRYDGLTPHNFYITAMITFIGSANDDVALQIRVYDDSAGSYVNAGPETQVTLKSGASSSRMEQISLMADCTLDTNDKVEIWIKNKSSTGNLTAKLGSHVIISRAI